MRPYYCLDYPFEHVPPAAEDPLLELRAGGDHLRDTPPPLVGAGGVNDHPRCRGIALLLGRDHRIQRGGEALPQDLDVPVGVHPGAHGPQDLVHIRHIDVLVHHHGESGQGRGGGDLGGHPRRLLGVAGIALPDGGNDEEAAVLVAPDPDYVGDARRLPCIPDEGSLYNLPAPVSNGGRLQGGGPPGDGGVAGVARLNFYYGLGPDAAGVVARELAEGPLGPPLLGVYEALDYDLGGCREGQPGDGPLYHIYRLASDGTGKVVLADAGRHLPGGDQKEEG